MGSEVHFQLTVVCIKKKKTEKRRATCDNDVSDYRRAADFFLWAFTSEIAPSGSAGITCLILPIKCRSSSSPIDLNPLPRYLSWLGILSNLMIKKVRWHNWSISTRTIYKKLLFNLAVETEERVCKCIMKSNRIRIVPYSYHWVPFWVFPCKSYFHLNWKLVFVSLTLWRIYTLPW